jgi:hypothetical protein
MGRLYSLSQKIMWNAVYGLDIISNTEDLPQEARDLLDITEVALTPGLHAYKHIPGFYILSSWIPGLGLRSFHRKIGTMIESLVEGPWEMALSKMVSTNFAGFSFCLK